MSTRICRYCNKQLPLMNFEIMKVVKGKSYRRWRCKTCQNDSKIARRNRIRNWVLDLKKTLQCSQCSEDDFRLLDFHHANNKHKDFNIGDAIRKGLSQKKILNEIKKCKVLCCKCHRILHWEESNLRIEVVT